MEGQVISTLQEAIKNIFRKDHGTGRLTEILIDMTNAALQEDIHEYDNSLMIKVPQCLPPTMFIIIIKEEV